jgi:hypothetical protein
MRDRPGTRGVIPSVPARQWVLSVPKRSKPRIASPAYRSTAAAIQHELHLMTRNVADFKPTGVLLVDPWCA